MEFISKDNKSTPGPKGVSAEAVLETAEALRQKTGKIPTVDEVRQALGTGSPKRVGDIMRPWRASLEPDVPVPAITDQVSKILKMLADHTSADVSKQYQERIARLTADNATFNFEIGRLEEELTCKGERLEQAESDRDSYAAKVKEQADELHALQLQAIRQRAAFDLIEQERDALVERQLRAEREQTNASERNSELARELSRARNERDKLATELDDVIAELADSDLRKQVRPRRPIAAVRSISSAPVTVGAIGRARNRGRTSPPPIAQQEKGRAE